MAEILTIHGPAVQFLSEELTKCILGAKYHLFTIKADLVLSNKPTDLTVLSHCRQEEVDTRMMLHLRHVAEQGYSKAYLRIVDTDVVVLAIYHFEHLKFSELWVGLGSGKAFKQAPIH